MLMDCLRCLTSLASCLHGKFVSSAVSEWPLSRAHLTMGLTQGPREHWEQRELEDQKQWLETLVQKPSAADRQSLSVTDGSLLFAIVMTVILGAQMAVVLGAQVILPPPQLSPGVKGKLESDKMCGITTGGEVNMRKHERIISNCTLSGRVLLGLSDSLRL